MAPVLICAANLSVEVIENFLSEASRSKYTGRIGWSLATSPNEPLVSPDLTKSKEWWPERNDPREHCPPIKPFRTGFLNASVQDMAKFLDSQPLCLKQEEPEKHNTYITHACFVVSDERSARDQTVLLYMRPKREPPEILEENPMISLPLEQQIHEWVELRLRWLTISFWACAWQNEGHFANFNINPQEYIDDNGIFQLPWVERSEGDIRRLRQVELAPLGPKKEYFPSRYPECYFVDEVNKGMIKTYPDLG